MDCPSPFENMQKTSGFPFPFSSINGFPFPLWRMNEFPFEEWMLSPACQSIGNLKGNPMKIQRGNPIEI